MTYDLRILRKCDRKQTGCRDVYAAKRHDTCPKGEKQVKIEIRADNSIHIEGYVNAVERDSNIINVPSVGRCVEQIRAGAFGRALGSGADVAILENHDTSRKLGSTSQGNLKLCEDNIGLRASADITDADIAGKARRGELKGWSFGFICTDSEIEQRAGNVPRRIVKGMTLSEVSLIDGAYKPCYNGTLVEVRSEGNFMEYRSCEDEATEIIVEERAEEIDYSYYDALLRYCELRYNPYHDPGNGRFTSGGGGGGGSVLVIPQGHAGVYKGNKAAMQKSMSSASQQASDRIKAMGGAVDENGRYSFQAHGGLMMIQGQTGATPTTTINVQTGNVSSQATNTGNGLTNPGNSGTIESGKYGNVKNDIAEFKRKNVAYKEVQNLDKPLTESEIIEKVGGGDKTKGSCVSVAYAYAANKAGYDVTDYRGGASQEIMSHDNRYRIDGMTDSVTPGNSILKSMTPGEKMKFLNTNINEGEEFIVSAGQHCAVVKKSSGKLHYLELQQEPGVRYSSGEIGINGWRPMTKASTMSERFGDKKKYGRYSSMTMIKASDLPKVEGFREMMGYVNTATNEQQKGRAGYAK
jgi:HK97 family phage prohead protease